MISANCYRDSAIADFVLSGTVRDEWPVLVFVREIEHGRNLAAAFTLLLDHPVPMIMGSTSQADRDETTERLRRRDPTCKVVVATDAWTTGIDIPTIRAVHDVSGRVAPIGLNQAGGRGARLAEGKEECHYYIYNETGLPPDQQEHQDSLSLQRILALQEGGQDMKDDSKLMDILDSKRKKGQSSHRDLLAAEQPFPFLLHIIGGEHFWYTLIVLLLVIYAVGRLGGCIK